MAEWSIAAVLKTVDLRGSGGSNPSLSAEMNRKMKIFRFFCVLTPPVQACLQTGGANTKKRCAAGTPVHLCKGPLAKREGMAEPVRASPIPRGKRKRECRPLGRPNPACRECRRPNPRLSGVSYFLAKTTARPIPFKYPSNPYHLCHP